MPFARNQIGDYLNKVVQRERGVETDLAAKRARVASVLRNFHSLYLLSERSTVALIRQNASESLGIAPEPWVETHRAVLAGDPNCKRPKNRESQYISPTH
jgi:hypothetical protein